MSNGSTIKDGPFSSAGQAHEYLVQVVSAGVAPQGSIAVKLVELPAPPMWVSVETFDKKSDALAAGAALESEGIATYIRKIGGFPDVTPTR